MQSEGPRSKDNVYDRNQISFFFLPLLVCRASLRFVHSNDGIPTWVISPVTIGTFGHPSDQVRGS